MSTKIPLVVPHRSYFDLSHMNILTMGFGQLVPTYNRLLLPGDSFHIRQSFNTRFLALLAPIMHRVTFANDWFFVPLRLLWEHFEDFISPKDFLTAAGPAMPRFDMTQDELQDLIDQGTVYNSLLDYLDLLPSLERIGSSVSFNPMPIAALRKIWNDFYRDQNLQEELEYLLTDGTSTSWLQGLAFRDAVRPLIRSYHEDYFTKSLPWTQKGNPVFIPFMVDVDAQGVRIRANQAVATGATGRSWGAQGNKPTATQTTTDGQITTTPAVTPQMPLNGNVALDRPFLRYRSSETNISELWDIIGIDATNGTATINDLRTALALQKWLERNARGGTRYVEYIFAHFGVVSPDARLQRAEWVGGNTTPIQISEVLQTSATNPDAPNQTPLGIPAGSAYSAGANRPIMYKAREHGILICLSSLLFDNVYASGQDREWRKFDRFDFFTPSFQNIGEQEVFATELGDAPMDKVFGYNPRYEEYRVAFSRVHGDMRKSLDFWHLARKFVDAPNLNAAFLQSNNSTITDRIFPYEQDEHPEYRQFLAQMHFAVKAFRPVPKFGLPGGLTL